MGGTAPGQCSVKIPRNDNQWLCCIGLGLIYKCLNLLQRAFPDAATSVSRHMSRRQDQIANHYTVMVAPMSPVLDRLDMLTGNERRRVVVCEQLVGGKGLRLPSPDFLKAH